MQKWAAEASNPHRLLDADEAAGDAALESLDGVTERSVLGALARHCAALLVDDWLLVLGAGGAGYPGLRDFNGPGAADPIDGAVVVALDRMGSGFAINGGGLPCGDLGEVCFLGAEDLTWTPCGLGHSAFVQWTLAGPVDQFYVDSRWDAWRLDVARLRPDEAIFSYPPPWSAEGRGENVHRASVPLREAWGATRSVAAEMRAELG